MKSHYLEMKEVWTNFVVQLEEFEEYCFDALSQITSKPIQQSSLGELLIKIMTTTVAENYQCMVILELKATTHKVAIEKVHILETMNQTLNSQIENSNTILMS